MGKKRNAGHIRLLICIGLGVLLTGDTLYTWYYIRALNLGIVLPGIIGAVLIAVGLKPYIFKGPIIRNKLLRSVFCWIIIACLVFFIIVEGLIIVDPYLYRAELAGKVDYVIVLGCGIWPDGSPTLALIYRLDKAVEYYRKNPLIKIIVSGGKGPDEPVPEAEAMAEFLIKEGIPESSIIAETRSTSTMENFKFSRSLMQGDLNKPVKIVFITSDFHVLRSRILAKRNGFEAYAIPAPTPAIIILNSYMREFFAFIKSMLVDY